MNWKTETDRDTGRKQREACYQGDAGDKLRIWQKQQQGTRDNAGEEMMGHQTPTVLWQECVGEMCGE